ncbi:hypothetical protein WME98_45455 [Sorangium sp. So ce296]|uniref:hypothetical protein n=1 Tax=Sorangium sp. So ce296 TaxID=3133296 RepID=UPI003F608CA3
MSEPYADRPGWSGAFNLPEEPLAAILDEGLHGSPRENQLLFHAVGDEAMVLSRDIFGPISPEEMVGTTSELTMVGGEIVWASGAIALHGEARQRVLARG